MARIDNAAAIRDRAYAIWEREGRPSGREHEHWAEAAREFEERQTAEEPSEVIVGPREDSNLLDAQEVERLRETLWKPADFSVELFRGEMPDFNGVEAVNPETLKHDGP